jgi:hypothetical protein
LYKKYHSLDFELLLLLKLRLFLPFLDLPFLNLFGGLRVEPLDFIHDLVHELVVGMEVSFDSPVGEDRENVAVGGFSNEGRP